MTTVVVASSFDRGLRQTRVADDIELRAAAVISTDIGDQAILRRVHRGDRVVFLSGWRSGRYAERVAEDLRSRGVEIPD